MVVPSKPPVFTCRDEAGKTVCRMGQDSETGKPFAEFFDVDGSTSIAVSSTPTGAAIAMFDKKARLRATVSQTRGGDPNLIIFNESGDVQLAYNPNGQPPLATES